MKICRALRPGVSWALKGIPGREVGLMVFNDLLPVVETVKTCENGDTTRHIGGRLFSTGMVLKPD